MFHRSIAQPELNIFVENLMLKSNSFCDTKKDPDKIWHKKTNQSHNAEMI